MGKQTVNFEMFDDEDSLPATSNIEVHVTENNSIYVTSREIASQLGQEHKNVLAAIKRIIDKDKSNLSATMFCKTTYTDSKNRQQPEYYVNQAGFNVLASGALLFNDIKKRLEFSIAFQRKNEEIRAKLNKVEKQVKKMMNTGTVPREVMVSQGLIAANEIINEQKQLIAQQQQIIEQKDQQIAANKSAVDFANAISTSTDCILIRQLAEHISQALKKAGYKNNVGQNNLFEWMRQNGYLKRGHTRDQNLPTKKCMEMGLMEVKTTPIDHKTMPGTWNSRTPLITAKGLEYFTLKFLNLYKEGRTVEDGPKK